VSLSPRRLITLVPVGLLCMLVVSGSARSDTYPPEPFNGMQIIYTVSGASFTKTEDQGGFTTSRSLTGRLTGGQLRVSGEAHMGSGYYADVVVTVFAGNERKQWKANIPTGYPSFNSKSFDLAVNVPAGAAGGFSIDMSGSYNAGGRGLVVSAALAAPPAPTPRSWWPLGDEKPKETEATPETPTPTPAEPRASVKVKRTPLAADGESTTEAVFTYLDDKGKPVSGVAVAWRIGPRLGPDEAGSLSGMQAATAKDGTARATYKAPLLEAQNMQETGEIKNREIWVDYQSGEKKGSVMGQLGLLKTAALQLIVEKPGVDRGEIPIRIGSLNGTISGTLKLKIVHYMLPGTPPLVPLNDALVKLGGEERFLGAAAVEAGRTDEQGRFALQMKMTNWERWDKAYPEPLTVPPSADFVARQKRCSQGLDKWPSSKEVALSGRELVLGAQAKLAALEAEKAAGLADKLQLFARMLVVLTEARGDGRTAAAEVVTHGWDLLKTAADYFYKDSQLEKAVNDKYRALETSSGLRALNLAKARWLRDQQKGSSVTGRLLGWLTRQVLKSGEPKDAQQLHAGRFVRSSLRDVLLPKVLDAISEALSDWVSENVLPDFGSMLTDAMLGPYVDRSNSQLTLFLANRDYEQIHTAATSVEASLTARQQMLTEEYQKAAAWRISADYAAELAGLGSELLQVGLKVTGVALAVPVLIEAAETLEKVGQAISTVTTGARFCEEIYRFVGILDRTDSIVLAAVAEAAGQPLPSADAAPAGGGAAVATMPFMAVAFANEPTPTATPAVDTLDLAATIDWSTLTPVDDRLLPEGVAHLLVAQDLVDGWQAERAPRLFALAARDPERVRSWAAQEELWEKSLARAQMVALRSADAPLSGEAATAWDAAVADLRQATQDLATLTASTESAIAQLPKPEDEVLSDAVKSRLEVAPPEVVTPTPGPSRRRLWLVGGLAALLIVGLAAVGAGVGLALLRRRRRLAEPVVAPIEAAPSTTGLPAFLTGLCDASGQVHRFGLTCTKIGSASDNDIVLGLRGISRQHARVWRSEAGDCWIEDLASTNGVYVSGARVPKAWLTRGVTVHLGSWEFTVV
jgi:hypothetical protein